jgi:proline dehydrogenase
MKLVRGAYMEIERERAAKMGYPDPICATKAETDANYNAVLKYMFENLSIVCRFITERTMKKVPSYLKK